ncbi:TetR/AcrR family transcriptional regulator [Roseibium sediminicola]|uniref:TetR/AcrR family transcriptional regulator n=1 Tax=Roseibium sediminicola TaxID=2933272 RepID=UPI003CE4DA82
MFNELGYTNVTIDRLMQEAGLTRGGFYAHFSSKAELFVEVVRAGKVGVLSSRWSEGPNLDLFEDMVRAYLADFHLDNLDATCPLSHSLKTSHEGQMS